MNDWLNGHWDKLLAFLAGIFATVFLGGREYQRMKSIQTEHEKRITSVEEAAKIALERNRVISSEIFNKIDAVKGELHQVSIQQASLTVSVDQYGRRMDALVERYDRANERSEQVMQEQLSILKQMGYQNRGGST